MMNGLRSFFLTTNPLRSSVGVTVLSLAITGHQGS